MREPLGCGRVAVHRKDAGRSPLVRLDDDVAPAVVGHAVVADGTLNPPLHSAEIVSRAPPHEQADSLVELQDIARHQIASRFVHVEAVVITDNAQVARDPVVLAGRQLNAWSEVPGALVGADREAAHHGEVHAAGWIDQDHPGRRRG